MKKLTSLILSVTIVPALALGTVAFAQDQGSTQDDQQGIGDQHDDKQKMSVKPAGELYADDIIGQTVKHRGSGEDIGEIQDLVIGDDGHIAGVVLTTGDFLGLGGKDVSLDWEQLEHTMEENESVFYVDMDEEALRNAPEHKRISERDSE